jgi:hypothetical protein
MKSAAFAYWLQKHVNVRIDSRLMPVYAQNLPFHLNPATEVLPTNIG